MKANARKPKNCLGQNFNFKLGRFVISAIAWHTQAQPHLELKLGPGVTLLSSFYPKLVCLSLAETHLSLYNILGRSKGHLSGANFQCS